MPRAELFALMAAVLYTAALPKPTHRTKLSIISDNKAVVDGFYRGPKTGQGNMDDLWERFWAIYIVAQTAGWEVSLQKIKSHTLEPKSEDESIDLEDMPYEHRLGNSYADYWAEVAAKTVACDLGHRKTVSLNDASGWLIRNRLLCICQNFLPQHKKELHLRKNLNINPP